MEILDLVRAKMSCCACEGTLKTSRHVNMVQLDRQATWKHPTAGNIFDPDKRPRAVAVLCDTCIDRNAEPKLAVEWDEETGTVKYHPVGELHELPPLRGEPPHGILPGDTTSLRLQRFGGGRKQQ